MSELGVVAMEATVELLQELISRQSLTESPNTEVSQFMSERLSSLGFDVHHLSYPDLQGVEKWAICAKRARNVVAQGRSVGYFCHNDVVSVDGWNCARSGPFDGAIAEQKVWGRGACDMKGSVAAALSALSSLDRSQQSADVFFFATGDEECGMAGAQLLAEQSEFFAELVDQQGVGIIGEPTELKLVNSHKGGCHFDVSSFGVAAHSSTADGRNANWQLIPFLNYLHSVARRMEIDPALVNRRFDPPTMSLNIVIDNEPNSSNITVGRASCKLFFRPMPETQWEELLEELRRTAQEMSLTISKINPLPPLHTPEDRASVREILAVLGQDRAERVCYATDGCCFQELSDLVVLGPGSIEQAHRPDEWISLDQLHRGVDVYSRLFRHFAWA